MQFSYLSIEEGGLLLLRPPLVLHLLPGGAGLAAEVPEELPVAHPPPDLLLVAVPHNRLDLCKESQ